MTFTIQLFGGERMTTFALKFIGNNPAQRYLAYSGIEKSETCGEVGVDVFDAGNSSHSFYYSTFCELPVNFHLVTVEVKSKAAHGKVMVHFNFGKSYRRCTLDVEGLHCTFDVKGSYNFRGRLGTKIEMTGVVVMPEVTLHFRESGCELEAI